MSSDGDLRLSKVGRMDGDSRLAQLAHSARWFLFAKTSNDRRRATYWRALAGLHRVQMRRRRSSLDRLHSPAVDIPASLGFATCAPGHIDGVDAVIDEVRRMRAQFPLGDERPYLLDQRLARLDPSSPLLRFALHPGVVAAAARYLGVVPKLAGVTILASPHVPRPFSGSQLFHSDWEDVRQVKVFVHCSDVTDASGPLTAVVADASRRVKQEVGYVYGGDHFRLTDDE